MLRVKSQMKNEHIWNVAGRLSPCININENLYNKMALTFNKQRKHITLETLLEIWADVSCY